MASVISAVAGLSWLYFSAKKQRGQPELSPYMIETKFFVHSAEITQHALRPRHSFSVPAIFCRPE